MGVGRVLLWFNVFVVPTLVIYAVAGFWVGLVAGVVNFLNALYIDTKIRPKLERLSKVLDRFLRSWG
jgi:capsular polysaccharide biosynthesis protein